eukprot:SAG31_NODE_3677_length_3996_cov_5.686939_2_plen_58_part_00
MYSEVIDRRAETRRAGFCVQVKVYVITGLPSTSTGTMCTRPYLQPGTDTKFSTVDFR